MQYFHYDERSFTNLREATQHHALVKSKRPLPRHSGQIGVRTIPAPFRRSNGFEFEFELREPESANANVSFKFESRKVW